ncbi:hypothetical protein HHI36_016349 [Cryptolaemus montrouzieri]|uniref:Uncharacterized protein n=1 Tax=Cryptolaemus montrouzieri TaxID=559131 RepID=A0ABD2NJP7_9CUCU
MMKDFGTVRSLGKDWALKNKHEIAEAELIDVDSLVKEFFGQNRRSNENFPRRMWYIELVDGPSSPPDDPSAAPQEDFQQ